MRSILISVAAQGIGAAIARLFYAHHYKVGIYDINSAQAQQLAASLGPNAKAGQLDVSNYQDWQTALAEFVAWAGELNILVNNTGILFSGPFEQTEISAHHKTMSINVNGVLNGCHAALPYLKQANFARIISKFAVRCITEGLDTEWQKYGIRVLDVMPLFVQTAMVQDMQAKSIQNMGVHLTAEDVAQHVFQRAVAKDTTLTATHQAVGAKAKLLFQLSKISPQFLNRLTNLYLSK